MGTLLQEARLASEIATTNGTVEDARRYIRNAGLHLMDVARILSASDLDLCPGIRLQAFEGRRVGDRRRPFVCLARTYAECGRREQLLTLHYSITAARRSAITSLAGAYNREAVKE
jgi:hypothetical protein